MKEPRKRPVPPGPQAVVPALEPDDKQERVSFALTKDGRMAVDQLRPSTLERLKKAFDDPAVKAAVFGVPVSHDENAGWMTVASQMTFLSGSLVAIAVERIGYGVEQAKTFILTPEEVKAIAEPASIGLRESFGSLEHSWQASLSLAVVSVFAPKILALKKPSTNEERAETQQAS